MQTRKHPIILIFVLLFSLPAISFTVPETEKTITLKPLGSYTEASSIIRRSILTVKDHIAAITYVEKRIFITETVYSVQSCSENLNSNKSNNYSCINLGNFLTLLEAESYASSLNVSGIKVVAHKNRVSKLTQVPELTWTINYPTNSQVLNDLESNTKLVAEVKNKTVKLCELKNNSKSSTSSTALQFVKNTIHEELYKGKYVLIIDTECR